ncbi:T9SS type A sorting domain-containing protein [Aequorivita antarctica]|uniref:T9SS type A sorting domain-containing protein n=1 Tax=Aequorivita antarctica TaxID=153266 RepID=A0A5C6Z1R4_9FLAO|nr:T9SS type A sorting domain-containing protein [Aequorivita antarctica]TXD73862.1 T9SS type A sorting domain-containing protein [Aequorivita antarctica]SRX73419.1 hypothetical protein AEQU3_00855 [Aequorivita antarctica]
MKLKLPLLLISFLSLQSFAQVDFENKIIIGDYNATQNPRSVFAADIDGDGDIDILSASMNDSKIAWYKNLDGQGTYGDQQLISVNAIGASSVFAIDIDGDSDMDVLSASSNDNKIAWYENLDGQGTFGVQQIITTDAINALSVFASDIDGDGDMDVISASGNINEGKIVWYENTDGLGNFGTQNIINPNALGVYSVYSADMDNDGDMDVLSASGLGNELVWFENIDSQGQFGAKQNIGLGNFKYVQAADIDSDGDMDVISASSNSSTGTIAWYENLDGQASFGAKQIITSGTFSPYTIFASDIDGDGDLDVISGLSRDQDTSIEWYENLDGEGNFSAPHFVNTSSGFTFSIYVADIDNNGGADIISASEDRIGFHKNLDGNGTFGPHQYFTYNVDSPQSIYAADIDGDGNLDVLSASYSDGEIAWYKNVDGYGNFSIQKTISQNNYGAKAVVAKDVDGDGDLDVVFVSQHLVAWQENLDGNGLFSEKKIIANQISSAYIDIAAEDMDGDGDVDVVTATFFTNKLSWFENLDGQGNFGSEQIIVDNFALSPYNIHVADINNDGRLDIVSASLINGATNWYENLGGGVFSPPQLIASTRNNNIDFVHASDLDGDNDLDVIITQRLDGKVVWFENIDGLGDFGPEKNIASGLDTPVGVYTSDLDNDGDLDVLSVSLYGDVVDWYENLDGAGNFGSQNIIMNNADGANFVLANDIDGDGDMDVIASLRDSNEIRWFKNTLILGTNEAATLNFSIYPNPSSNTLNINCIKTIQKVEIYNNLGQLITRNINVLNDSNSELNVSKLEAGVYFIKIISADGEIGVRRFIKV